MTELGTASIGAMELRINLIPLAAGILLISVATSIAATLIRQTNRSSASDEDLGTTIKLTLLVAMGLVGVVFLFLGLFE